MPPRSTTNLASLARNILQWAEERGLDRARLLRVSQLDVLALEGEDARIPSRAIVTIWREIERLLADPSFGLKSAESILKPSSLGVVGLLAMTSKDVGESIERAVRYSRVVKEDVVARSYLTDHLLVIELQALGEPTRAIMDVSMVAFRHFMEQWTGHSVAVKEVFFQHARPDEVADYERLFPCPVHFEHPTNSIVFDREVASIPLLTAQPEIASYLERVACSKLAELERLVGGRANDSAGAIVRAVRDAVDRGDTRIDIVARGLGMSARTLQRVLGERGLVYRQLVDDARLAVATPLVTQTDEPIDEIATRLGYSDSKAFRRAFRRWTGFSPHESRRVSQRSG